MLNTVKNLMVWNAGPKNLVTEISGLILYSAVRYGFFTAFRMTAK